LGQETIRVDEVIVSRRILRTDFEVEEINSEKIKNYITS
jgi:hypothetical protein